MTDKPISPLRQRMIEDMTVRHFAEKAQKDYIRYVKNFAAFLGRSPDAATVEDLRLFQLNLRKTHENLLYLFRARRRLCARRQNGRGEVRLGGSPPSQSQSHGKICDRAFAELTEDVRRRAQSGAAGGAGQVELRRGCG
jgi:hypothetical protein